MTFAALFVSEKRDKHKVALCFFAGENFNVALIFHHMHPKPTKKRKPRIPRLPLFLGGYIKPKQSLGKISDFLSYILLFCRFVLLQDIKLPILVYHIICLMSRQIINFRRIKMARIIDGSAMNLVGKKIKKLRKQRKMTQRELSEKLELLGVYVCRGSVSRMEERTRTVTDIELYAISCVFGVPVSALFEE